jgi:hypothetical protein
MFSTTVPRAPQSPWLTTINLQLAAFADVGRVLLGNLRAQVLHTNKGLDKLLRLGVVCIAMGFKGPFPRGMSFLQCVVHRLQLSESGMFLVTVVGKVFRSFDKFPGGAVRLVFGELQSLHERIQLELYMYLINNAPGYNERWHT